MRGCLMSSPEQIIEEYGFYSAPVHGMSMYPLLKNHRDTVCILPPDKLKKYDVVLFRRQSGQLVLHRILKIDGNRFYICGDNEFRKEIVYKNQIIGKMTEFCRNNKNGKVTDLEYKIYSYCWNSSFLIKRILLRIYTKFFKG